MARRRFQRGSLVKDKDRWVARWREDVVLPSGEVKRVRRKEILGWLADLPTKKLAERELARRLESVNRIDYRPTPLATFAEFAAKWQRDVMVHHKASTQRGEKSKITVHLIPAFGRLALRDIQPEMLQSWVSRQKCSPKMVRNVVGVLSEMWTTARAWGYVHTNPLDGLKLPTAVKGKAYAYTPEEALAIIDKAEGRWKVFLRLVFEAGMRPGEIAGLRVEDVEGRRVWVKQSVWGGKVQTPKSENSVRSFVVSEPLAAAIQEMIDESAIVGGSRDVSNRRVLGNADTCGTSGIGMRCEGVYAEGGGAAGPHGSGRRQPGESLLFPSAANTPLSMDNFRHRVLTPILDDLGITAKVKALGLKAGLYPGRHMNATLLSRIVPMKTVQARLGHSIGSAVTADHYIHAVEADDLAAADALGALLSPKGTEAVQ